MSVAVDALRLVRKLIWGVFVSEASDCLSAVRKREGQAVGVAQTCIKAALVG